MNAAIIAIGNELLSGRSVDTNSAYLSRALSEVGIKTTSHQTIGDSAEDIANAITNGISKADLVIVTGGLGPTEDDVTRTGLAIALGKKLVLNSQALEQIRQRFETYKMPMAKANQIQAMIPESVEIIPNSWGTAPAMYCEMSGTKIFVLPGVPREMKNIFTEHVLPGLGTGDKIITQKIIHTYGAGESVIGEKIADIMNTPGPVTVGTTVANGMVSIRLLITANSMQHADQIAKPVIDEICDRLGELVVSCDEQMNLPAVVEQMLSERSLTVTAAESCTGGLFAKMLTDISGSSKCFKGSIVTYDNQVKAEMLNVDRALLDNLGAVSSEVAEQMAVRVKDLFKVDYAVAITGIAGPTGATPQKPVGLVYIAVATPSRLIVTENNFSGDRQRVRLRSALKAFNIIRLDLLKSK